MKMETLQSLRLIAEPGDHWVSFDLKDRFYSVTLPREMMSFSHLICMRKTI